MFVVLAGVSPLPGPRVNRERRTAVCRTSRSRGLWCRDRSAPPCCGARPTAAPRDPRGSALAGQSSTACLATKRSRKPNPRSVSRSLGRWKAMARVRRRPRHPSTLPPTRGCSSARQSTSFATKMSNPPKAMQTLARLANRQVTGHTFGTCFSGFRRIDCSLDRHRLTNRAGTDGGSDDARPRSILTLR